MSKIKAMVNVVSRTAGRSGLVIKKFSPEILLTLGIVGTVASTVMACKATTKADEVLKEAQDKIQKIKDVKTSVDEGVYTSSYTETEYKKDLTVVYAQTGVSLVKVYRPALTLGVASIGFILGAHGIMRKRNLALVAAYKAVEQSFTDYRKRVVEELGEEKDRQFKYGIKKTKLDINTVDENGNEVKAGETVNVVDPNGISQYAKFFDEYSTQWSKIPEYNLTFLKCQQNYANDLLNSKGHVFLNEVYDMLGIPRTQAGCIVGWLKGHGDDFVDFGIYDPNDESKRLFVNGHERSILLDFNVDGVIYDMI